ncbi:MAG: hypothetical protein ACK5XO_05120, partial [Phycisphaerales bacterium]
ASSRWGLLARPGADARRPKGKRRRHEGRRRSVFNGSFRRAPSASHVGDVMVMMVGMADGENHL